MKQHVRMGFDQTGHQRQSRQIDDFAPAGALSVAAGPTASIFWPRTRMDQFS